ncbi:hypothetical protein LIER_30760 [Lithospermum erythrorhizon]|uniref:Uncharacterized protein n=1 Tax=Lithospermum erythrorhizon TaxID=34254 RepID=A0AAV3RSG7_LITER
MGTGVLPRINKADKSPDRSGRRGTPASRYLHLRVGDVLQLYLAVSMIEAAKPRVWLLYVVGASNPGGSGAEKLLWSPEGHKIQYALRFTFTAMNNEAEFEAFANGLSLSNSLGQNTSITCPTGKESRSREVVPPGHSGVRADAGLHPGGVGAGRSLPDERETARVSYYAKLANEEGLGINLDLLEEKRIGVVYKMARYNDKVAAHYNKKILSRRPGPQSMTCIHQGKPGKQRPSPPSLPPRVGPRLRIGKAPSELRTVGTPHPSRTPTGGTPRNSPEPGWSPNGPPRLLWRALAP